MVDIKKLYKGIVLLVSLLILLIPLKIEAQYEPIDECELRHNVTFVEDPECDEGHTVCESGCAYTTDEWALCCVVDAIFTIADWVFYILIAISGVMVVMGGFNIVTAGGDPGKVTTGRNYITYAMLGLLVALFARAIPALTRSLIGS